MPRTDSPAADETRRRVEWWGAVTLLLAALVWRLPYAVTRSFNESDELWYSLPTVERMVKGEWLFYISGTNYGAPVQEFLASLLFRVFGESAITLRLPVVILGAVGVVVAYRSLRTVVRERAAFGMSLLLACAGSAVAHYTTFAHPCYAATFLLVGVLQLLTFRLDRARTARGWWALALTMGGAFYLFKLSLLQSAASLAWLWWRSENADRLRARARTVDGAQALCRAGVWLGAGALLLAPVAYRFLTRRRTFVMLSWEKGLLAAALVALLIGAWLATRAMARTSRREAWPGLVCALALGLIPLPAALWHARVEAPRVLAQGRTIYAEKRYELKHWRELPHQTRLVLQGIIPALIIGHFDYLIGEPTETEPLDWRAGVSVAVLAVLAWFGGKRLRAAGWRVPLRAGDTVLIAPFLITAAIMFPSWALHSECCFRYLVPFLAGGLLFVYRALEEPIVRYPRVVVVVLVVLILQNGVDCYRFMEAPWPETVGATPALPFAPAR
ncbi:MAG: glycosyltransferase family 39 protein [Chthoniobacter sp.]|nr:glycosyltransferase family 39 protein [Chthoniobacter sp.]